MYINWNLLSESFLDLCDVCFIVSIIEHEKRKGKTKPDPNV